MQLRKRNPLVALVHHPLALETGLDAATAQALRESERTALGCARAVIVTSEPTAEILAARLCCAGRSHRGHSSGRRSFLRTSRNAQDGDNVHLLAVGSITPRKGYDVLSTCWRA